ncbi:MAG: 2-oxoadipate dioxygenase/decarboxylase family protein [Phycisphaerales bacterium]
MTSLASGTPIASKLDMQHRLFAELSAMFGREVPLYDKSLLVNRACNATVCALLGRIHPGFRASDAEIDRASGERHGAIRIGRADEYRWVCRLFACFAMEPHDFYDMTAVGAKSQPMIATAFRSVVDPEHRVFASLLMTDYFEAGMRGRIEAALAGRTIFGERARQLIERSERNGGLAWSEASELISECTSRIFKWTGEAHDHALYRDLVDGGFKIAADIACFDSLHLNHLTPNTLCMDLYTAAMKRCLGEVDRGWFESRACAVLGRLAHRLWADSRGDWMLLHFKQLSTADIAALSRAQVDGPEIAGLARALADELDGDKFSLEGIVHAGSKGLTEGPSEDTPVFLRQDAYRALTEPVAFRESDGSVVHATHTARFGEIEERFYACTPAGRRLYDACLLRADEIRERDPELPKQDPAQYEAAYAAAFLPFPKSVPELVAAGLCHARFRATDAGIAARDAGVELPCDAMELVRRGFAALEGLRYEDFLPVSAAGIFASNLQQYGTRSTASVKPAYSRALIEEILGKSVVEPALVYAGIEAETRLETLDRLGVLARIDAGERTEYERRVAALRAVLASCGIKAG